MLLAKATLNTIKFWFLKIDSFINYDKFFAVNNVLREQNEMKEETKHPKNAVRKTIQKKMQTYHINCKKSLRTKIPVSEELNKNQSLLKVKKQEDY